MLQIVSLCLQILDGNTVIYYFCCCTNIFFKNYVHEMYIWNIQTKMQITNYNEIGRFGVLTVLIVNVTQQNY